MHPSAIEILATVFFACAVLHTFAAKSVAKLAHRFPKGSVQEGVLHFLAETEVIFGLWALALFLGIMVLTLSLDEAVHYIESLNFAEPKFVLVVMVVAATKPVIQLAESIITAVARALPLQANVAFYLVALSLGSLLGSFITEPAAMTLLALILKRRYFDQGVNSRFAYATLGLLFVNVSIGGTLTHFAAPPVLMVAGKWGWGVGHMLMHFGWRAAASCLLSSAVAAVIFRKQLAALPQAKVEVGRTPAWLTAAHVLFLALVVLFAHYPDIVLGVLVIFLGLVSVTKEHQEDLKLREGLLVGFFLAGLVTLGGLQSWWLKPLIENLNGSMLFFGATGLTAITDNAALTYLGSLVDGISPELQYALVAGAVAGGGLTVIANAPNPAGIGILQGSKVFGEDGISPIGLFLAALPPTCCAVVFFWLVG